jgi:hypothetical protein
MRRTHRLTSVLLLVLIIGAATFAATRPGQAAPAGPSLGEPVRIVGLDPAGAPVEVGTITVNAFEDPYQYQPSMELRAGERLVLIDLAVTNSSAQPVDLFDVTPDAVDAEGRLISGNDMLRGESDPRPGFWRGFDRSLGAFYNPGEVAPGETRAGVWLFAVADNVPIAQVLYYPSGSLSEIEQAVPVLDLRAVPPGYGDRVLVVAADPFSDYTGSLEIAAFPPRDLVEPSGAAAAMDTRPVGVTFWIKNTDAKTVTIRPNDFLVLDAEGFPSRWEEVERTAEEATVDPTLYGAELAPGESVTGFLGFRIRAESSVAAVVYHPVTWKMDILGQAGVVPTDPLPTPTPPTIVEGPDGYVVVTPGCEGVAEWSWALEERLTSADDRVAEELAEVDDITTADPAMLREAAAIYRQLADEQAASTPPPAAAAFGDAVVAAYRDLAAALEALAEAIESGDQARVDAAIGAFESIGTDVDPAFESLAAACPEADYPF